MSRILRAGSLVCAIASTALFGLGVAAQFGLGAGLLFPEQFELDAPVKSFGTAPSNSRFHVSFRLVNRGSRPVKVIGATPAYCMQSGCLEVDGLPIEVPPRQSRELPIVVTTRLPGNLDGTVVLYTDCPGKSEVGLEIKGQVVPSPEPM